MVLAWIFALALICTAIREAKGDIRFAPEGYLSGYFAYALIFGIVSYKTREPKVNPPAPTPDSQSESN
jgi:hypothetical protein